MWKLDAETKTYSITNNGFTAYYKVQKGAFVATEFRTPWGLFAGGVCDNVAHARRYCLRELRRKIAEAEMIRATHEA